MSKKIAHQIAKSKLDEIMSGNKARILEIFKNPEFEFPVQDGVEYQVRMLAYYDHKESDLIQVEVIVDDGRYWDRNARASINVSELKAYDVP